MNKKLFFMTIAVEKRVVIITPIPDCVVQSTTRITDFLVVDKSSVILVKRPKIR